MRNTTKYIALIAIIISTHMLNAQTGNNSNRIKILTEQKEAIKIEERDFLKTEVEFIIQRLEKGEITQEKADELKLDAAKKRALNIENRTSIIDHKIALLERNDDGYLDNDGEFSVAGLSIGGKKGSYVGLKIKGNNEPIKYDRRTLSEMVIAVGLNNAIIDGEKLDNSPYEFGGSRFFELGWAWKTRVFNESNFMRLKYGVSLHINGLKPTDNRYFVENGNQTTLELFSSDLKKSKLSITNLVIPIHFEFGPSKKIEKDNYFRYSTSKQFKIGLGGYAGFNIGTRQKLKYTLDGDSVKDKFKKDYNTSDLVYGLSSYIAFNTTALYIKYDLSPIFKNQTIEQNNISLGVRFDME
ncbi:hypothetical protein [Lutibacter sp.]|uniref:hypothetical protein n=1 Tax=Lutibacter sp. TaxID=1925666 RepID=UPI00273578DE|nr:hypothetical protein [Lutibacter sp.]MDP3314398.1 hypothetical protein [Lutibacter sp.]